MISLAQTEASLEKICPLGAEPSCEVWRWARGPRHVGMPPLHGGSSPRDGLPKATEPLAKIPFDCHPPSVGGDGGILWEGVLRDRLRRATMLQTTFVLCFEGRMGP